MKHAAVDGVGPRHWHVTERRVRLGRFRRAQVVGQLGAVTAGAAYGALARRVSELVLDGWSLRMEHSTDALAVLERDGVRSAVDVVECSDGGCLTARAPAGVGTAAS
jgi:hypothetical protein